MATNDAKSKSKSYVQDKKGNKAACFDLILQKKFAYAMLTGQKTIEFRAQTPHYLSRFCTPETVAQFKKGKITDFKTKRCFFVHFHDYNATWFLDVAIEAVDFMAASDKNLAYFHDHKCHEVDSLIAENIEKGVKLDDPEMQWFFCLPITAIINTNLDTSKINTIRQMDIPQEFWL